MLSSTYFWPETQRYYSVLRADSLPMITEIYIEALLVDDKLAELFMRTEV